MDYPLDYSKECEQIITEIYNNFQVKNVITFGDFSFINNKQKTLLEHSFRCIGADIHGVDVFNNSLWYFPLYDFSNILKELGIIVSITDLDMVITSLNLINLIGWGVWVEMVSQK